MGAFDYKSDASFIDSIESNYIFILVLLVEFLFKLSEGVNRVLCDQPEGTYNREAFVPDSLFFVILEISEIGDKVFHEEYRDYGQQQR